ncbi:MAG: imidazole glycerol phosphate synthase subunit HisH [Marinilabiliaceae bacterium]|nr:imidazole glycerol phosphate synthase subunit HisH [Marinilabiliaceae bacterium]
MKIVIIKYNAGNIRSVANAIARLGYEAEITDDEAKIRAADRVIFPGVGEAGTTMKYLREHGLDKLICSLKQPILGICLGMQLMCSHSEEGDTDCLGIFDVPVKRFQLPSQNIYNLKIPQMGWNVIENCKAPLFSTEQNGKYVYFVHSYYVPLCDYTAAETEHVVRYSSALHRDNFYATQFHPEKSGDVGECILSNFLNL